MIIDAKTGKRYNDLSFTGLCGYISWRRLSELLQKEEARPGEEITHFRITERGIEIKFKS